VQTHKRLSSSAMLTKLYIPFNEDPR
jgi:hypothetical protein